MSRALSAAELQLCTFQARLFEDSPRFAPYSSAVFVRRFMNSNVARAFDSGLILLASTTNRLLVHEVDQEYPVPGRGTVLENSEILYWTGYIYRYWCCLTHEDSSAVFKQAPAKELFNAFEPYHSLDPAAAIRRILEAAGLSTSSLDRATAPQGEDVEAELIERGVGLLRSAHDSPDYEYFALRFE